MKNGSMTYFCKWVLDNTFFGTADAWGASQSLLSIMGAVPMAVAAVFIVPLCNKFGKRLVCMAGMIVGAVGGVIAIMGNGQIIPVAVGVALKCLGSSPACYMILAMLADVIDHIEYKKKHPYRRFDDVHIQFRYGCGNSGVQFCLQRNSECKRLQPGGRYCSWNCSTGRRCADSYFRGVYLGGNGCLCDLCDSGILLYH